jgi:hypothetical protein
MTGPIELTERSRPYVRECSACGRPIIPLHWYPDTPVETDQRLTWVHVETGKRTHTGICISVLYANPKEPDMYDEHNEPGESLVMDWNEHNDHADGLEPDEQQDNEPQEEYDALFAEHKQEAAERRRDIADALRDDVLPFISGLRRDLAMLEEIDCGAGCDNCIGSASADHVRAFLDDAARSLAAARALMTEGLGK